jgi:hypothetical protein
MDLGNCKELIDNRDDVIDVVVMAQEENDFAFVHTESPDTVPI